MRMLRVNNKVININKITAITPLRDGAIIYTGKDDSTIVTMSVDEVVEKIQPTEITKEQIRAILDAHSMGDLNIEDATDAIFECVK